MGGPKDDPRAVVVLPRRVHGHRAGQDHARAVARRPGGIPHGHHARHLAVGLSRGFMHTLFRVTGVHSRYEVGAVVGWRVSLKSALQAAGVTRIGPVRRRTFVSVPNIGSAGIALHPPRNDEVPGVAHPHVPIWLLVLRQGLPWAPLIWTHGGFAGTSAEL